MRGQNRLILYGQLTFDKGQIQWEKERFLQQMVLGKLDSHIPVIKSDPYLTWYTKIISKLINDLYTRIKS